YAKYMVIGVISDTHDRLPQLESALDFFASQQVRTIVHCGDWKSLETVTFCAERSEQLGITVHGVLGNNDVAVQDFLAYAGTAPGNFSLMEGVLKLNVAGKR